MPDQNIENADMLAELLPEGPLWDAFRVAGTKARALLDAKASGITRLENRAVELMVDLNPAAARETLAAREREAGLPGPCAIINPTLEERRMALVNQWASRGGQSVSYFTAMATSLSYGVAITEARPFRAGYSQCGGRHQCGDPAMRHHWWVSVPGPRINYFRCGQSQAGRDPLGFVRRAEDLECLLTRLKPAHSDLHFAYEGI